MVRGLLGQQHSSEGEASGPMPLTPEMIGVICFHRAQVRTASLLALAATSSNCTNVKDFWYPMRIVRLLSQVALVTSLLSGPCGPAAPGPDKNALSSTSADVTVATVDSYQVSDCHPFIIHTCSSAS